MSKKDNKIGTIEVGVDISAKAEIKAEVPSSSVGRFVDAFTDMISPFSEARGLKGDQIRLQREDIAIKIAKKAKERLDLENKAPIPISNKFLVPFLEKSSLESDDESLQDMWSALLANTATEADAISFIALNVISEMTTEEAKILSSLFESIKFNKIYNYHEYLKKLDEYVNKFFEETKIINNIKDITEEKLIIEIENLIKLKKLFILREISLTSRTNKININLIRLENESHIFDSIESRRLIETRELHTEFGSKPFVAFRAHWLSHLGYRVMQKLS